VRTLLLWFRSLFWVSIAVIVAYLWLDRPIALLAHNHFRQQSQDIFASVGNLPNPVVVLADAVFVVIGLLSLFGRQLSKHEAAALLGSTSVIFAATIKDQLKFVFGRTGPESWIPHEPSFIRDQVYGFHFMHGGNGYYSFPSGHMAVACAVIAVLWIWYPQLRWLYTIVGLVVAVGLVAANFHFVSDVIAGAFVGISTGWMVTAIWKVVQKPG
jgi:membrane-associated phospholipid phosphatase